MFCSRPFTQFYIDERGDVWQCCPGWITQKAGNILQSDPMDIWYGQAAREVRESIIDQSFRYCSACPFLPDKFMKWHLESGSPYPCSTDEVETVVLSHDPVCNLRCPSCRNEFRGSSRMVEAITDIVLESGLLSQARSLSSSDVGDPVASSSIWSLLCNLPVVKPGFSIFLHTNGLLLTACKWDELGSAKEKVRNVTVSIDAASEYTYGLNRGGDWFRLLENLEWMSQAGTFDLDFNFVVQENNFREMVDLVRLADHFGVRFVRFSYLTNKGTYSEGDYLRRAIHLPNHPNYLEFLRIVANPLLGDCDRILFSGLDLPGRRG
jgi:MoaA/NifB/PqqE/SkfB family radical SAM enzyme